MTAGRLQGKTILISGSSRGIGRAIALRAARDCANVVILAKTSSPHPKLSGTIYTAAEDVEKLGGKALPIVCDIRNEKQVENAVNKAVQRFGTIDILVNNASAISLTNTQNTTISRYDLMNNINARGTWLLSKICMPYLKKSSNPHILTISPPLSLEKEFFGGHVAYSISKFGMSLCTLGLSEELKEYNIAANSLWPLTPIYTAALKMIEGANNKELCRTEEIMADAAYSIITRPSSSCTGNFFIDEEVLRKEGVCDFSKYLCVKGGEDSLGQDFFITEEHRKMIEKLRQQSKL